MDNLKLEFDNLKKISIQHQKMIPIVRKNGHPFMLRDPSTSVVYMNENTQQCQLTATDLRQLHKSF